MIENNGNLVQQRELNMLLEIDRIAKKYNILYFLAYGTVLGAIRHKGFIPWDTDIDIIVDIDNYEKLCKCLKKDINQAYEINFIKYDNTYDSLKARISLKDQSHNEIHIDIFPMCGAPISKFGKIIFSKIAYINYRSFFIKKVNADLNYKNDSKKRRIVKVLKVLLAFIPASTFEIIQNYLVKLFPLNDSKYLYNICGSYGLKEYIPKSWILHPVYKEFEGHYFPVPREWDLYLTHIYGDYMTPKKNNYI